MLRRITLLTALVTFSALPTLNAQTPKNFPTAYDVSTVKPSQSSAHNMSLNWGNDHISAENVTLDWLLTNALHCRMDQLAGLPDWVKTQHFDITAKLTDVDPKTLKDMPPEQYRILMQSLLADRFGLKYHVESREMAIYDLEPVKTGIRIAPRKDGDGKDLDGVCSGCIMSGDNSLKAHDIDVANFVDYLSAEVARDVRDHTGLTGKIDVNLKWAPDVGTPASDDAAALPPMPAALEKELGLRLVSDKGPVKIFVIDRLEKPSAN